ncbi:MAG: hypothetical protein HQ589_04330, partial [Syntrophaceae bacterium]|nr:hypothetical protein [Syntrophaceae bacterium]
SALMTIIYGIAQGREGIFDSWKHFTVRLMKYLGLDSIQEVGYPPRQRIATAAFYVTRGSEANKGNFAEAILDIELLFGVTKEDLREKEPLKLSEKLTIITAAQKVATTTDGNAKFRDAVREMSDIFDIEKERHHLEIPDKVRLITAVYETMTIKDGIKKFKDAVMGIDDIFNITEDELQRSLDIAEKIKVITAAYHIARAPDGMKIFEETIKKIGEKFNITDAQMKGISADGSEGLALHDKIRLITAGYAVALSAHSKGLEVFSRAIIAIGDIFGISDNEMKGIASEGRESLVLSDRMRLITAGYQAAQSGGGVSQFRRTVKGIKDIFDISDDSLKRELKLSDKMSFITAAYHVNLAKNGLDRFNKMIARDLINQIPHMTLESKVGFITTYASRVRWSGVGAEEMVSAGLIGKYMPVTDIEFVKTDADTRKGIIRFKAYHIEDPQKSEVEITINAGRAPPGCSMNT